ncbi:hypothetical protein ZWY2020_003165 [Hordeum vulgare]|nr:hypothetical protein ZWY2020_003165 [Hordeum vulgare]
MDMRAVCSTWRSAIAKPSPLAAVAGLRFRPRHWVMLDLQADDRKDDDDARLFLHVPTGRFCRLHLPVLRDNFVRNAFLSCGVCWGSVARSQCGSNFESFQSGL